MTSYPATLLVSYQTYRQLSGWILPPLVIHALSGHTATSVIFQVIAISALERGSSSSLTQIIGPYHQTNCAALAGGAFIFHPKR